MSRGTGTKLDPVIVTVSKTAGTVRGSECGMCRMSVTETGGETGSGESKRKQTEGDVSSRETERETERETGTDGTVAETAPLTVTGWESGMMCADATALKVTVEVTAVEVSCVADWEPLGSGGGESPSPAGCCKLGCL